MLFRLTGVPVCSLHLSETEGTKPRHCRKDRIDKYQFTVYILYKVMLVSIPKITIIYSVYTFEK